MSQTQKDRCVWHLPAVTQSYTHSHLSSLVHFTLYQSPLSLCRSELRQLCRYYEPYGLSYRDCIERVPLDNKGYIDFSSFCEYVQDNYHYPSTRTNGYLDTSGPRRLASPSARGQTSSVHPTYNMSRSLRDIHGSRSGLLDATDSYYPGTTESPLPSSRRQRTPHEVRE